MNEIRIIVQSKDEPKNLLSTKEKADSFKDGLTVVYIESATQGGQIGVELIFKGVDIYGQKTIIGYAVTENNWEALMGAFIGVRMRFGRMPEDQWEMVRHYVKQQVERFLQKMRDGNHKISESELRNFFGL